MKKPDTRMIRHASFKNHKVVLQNSEFPFTLDTGGVLHERNIPYHDPGCGYGVLREWWFDGVLIVTGQFAFRHQMELSVTSGSQWIRLNYDLAGKQGTEHAAGFPPCVPTYLREVLIKEDSGPAEKKVHDVFRKTFVEVNFTRAYFKRIACHDCVVLQKIAENICGSEWLRNGGITVTLQMQYVLSEMLNCKLEGHTRRLFLESKALELFTLQVEQYKNMCCACLGKNPVRPQDLEKFHKARRLLDSHFNYPFTLKYIALHSGLNEFKLKKGFKEIFGKAVFQYLKEIRLLKARELLLNHDLTVAEAAERVGFKYAHHFIAVFKKEFGCTPGEFRQALQKE